MRLYKSKGGHGIVSRKQLLNDGATRREIKAAEISGDLRRVDRSRYAFPDTDERVIIAATAGATLTCRSALEYHGLWTMPDSRVHVRQDRYARRRRALPMDTLQCGQKEWLGDVIVDDITAALGVLHALHGEEETVVALDSIAHRRGMGAARRFVPTNLRSLLRKVDRRCESAAESIVRQRLARSGIRLQTQVQIDGVGRVDFLIGRRIIVEVDGHEHHSTKEGMAKDRRRDRRAMLLGYMVFRITWQMILHEWDDVLHDILAVLQTRRHRRPPKPFRKRARLAVGKALRRPK